MAVNEFYAILGERIDNASDCSALEELTTEITAILAEALASIQSAIDALVDLVTPPTDLPEVIAWIEAAIETYLGPYNKLLLLQINTIAQQAILIQKLADKVSDLGCD